MGTRLNRARFSRASSTSTSSSTSSLPPSLPSSSLLPQSIPIPEGKIRSRKRLGHSISFSHFIDHSMKMSIEHQEEAKTSMEVNEEGRKSPTKKNNDRSVIGRMLSRAKLVKLPSFEESFDMVSDFDSTPERKRARPDPFLPSPERKQARSTTPQSPFPAPPSSFRFNELKRGIRQVTPGNPDTLHNALNTPLPISPKALPPPPPTTATSHLDVFVKQEEGANRSFEDEGDLTIRAGVKESPMKDEIFREFDKLFADFPLPSRSTSLHRSASQLATAPRFPPSLSSASSSSSSLSSAQTPTTPISPYIPQHTSNLSQYQPSSTSSQYSHPIRLESAITSLSQVIMALQATQADQATYILRQADLEMKLRSLDQELGAVRQENLRLEVTLRKEKEERRKLILEEESKRGALESKLQSAEAEIKRNEQIISEYDTSSTSSQSLVRRLQNQLQTSASQAESLQNHIRELEGEISRITGNFDIVKSEHQRREEGLKRKLDESEFMHRALKESGAKLGREVESLMKRCSELEKRGKGGFI